MAVQMMSEPRLFVLDRSEDVSGVSGTGVVAEGVVFSTGKTVMAWVASPLRSVAIYESIDELTAIHGHDGRTRVVFRAEGPTLVTRSLWECPCERD